MRKQFSSKRINHAIGTLLVSRGMECPCANYPAFSNKEQDEIDYVIAMLERLDKIANKLQQVSVNLSQSRDVDAQIQANIYDEVLQMILKGKGI